MSLPSTAAGSKSRLNYLDWLRVLAMFGIFFFHNARFYDIFSDWHVRNAATNIGASIVVAFMSQWIMPLFFLIAGAGTYYAFRSRQAGQYMQERTLRLFIPLIFGMFVIVVPQAYFEALFHGVQLGGYNLFQIYLLYLQSLPELNWFHLWFLAYLFVFSIIVLPVFVPYNKQGNSVISRIAGAANRPWLLLPLLVLPLAVAEAFLNPAGFWGSEGSGGWNIVAYLLFFVFGYMLFANARIMETVRRLGWVFLGAALVISALLVSVFLATLMDSKANFGSGMYTAAKSIQALSTWCWLLSILGLGSRYLNSDNKFLSYANEAVLPFYILHQTVIISIGFYVVQWGAGVGLKYLIISTTSFAVIMLVYELLVRRINILRFLFGMKPERKPKAALSTNL